jgi:hypothetical protein
VLAATYRLTTRVPTVPGYYQDALYLHDGSLDNAIKLVAHNQGGGAQGAYSFSGGVTKLNAASVVAAPAVDVRRRQAVAWSDTRGQVAHDGVLDATQTLADGLPVAPTTLDVGRYSSHGGNLIVESIAYYRGAKADQFVQQVTR